MEKQRQFKHRFLTNSNSCLLIYWTNFIHDQYECGWAPECIFVSLSLTLALVVVVVFFKFGLLVLHAVTPARLYVRSVDSHHV